MQPKRYQQLVVQNKLLDPPEDPIQFRFYEDNDAEIMAVTGGWNGAEWGKAVGRSAVGPGFLMEICRYDLDKAVTNKTTPSEPVLNLHVQVSNEAYCSFNNVKNLLLQEDTCVLFVQSTRKFSSYMLPGDHIHLNVYYSKRFLTSIVHKHPGIEPLLELLSRKETTPIDERVITASPAMVRLIHKFLACLNPDERPELTFCQKTAVKMLLEFL